LNNLYLPTSLPLIVYNRYTPAVSEVLKFAWVQYMAFFFVVAFLLFRLNAFIFKHRVCFELLFLLLCCSYILLLFSMLLFIYISELLFLLTLFFYVFVQLLYAHVVSDVALGKTL
jgi:hypothetical protein